MTTKVGFLRVYRRSPSGPDTRIIVIIIIIIVISYFFLLVIIIIVIVMAISVFCFLFFLDHGNHGHRYSL